MFAAAAGGISNRRANEQQAEGQQSEAASEGCDRHQVCTEERSGEITEFKIRTAAGFYLCFWCFGKVNQGRNARNSGLFPPE